MRCRLSPAHQSPSGPDTCSKFIAALTDNQTCVFDAWNQLYAKLITVAATVTSLVNILTVIIVKLAVRRPSLGTTGKTTEVAFIYLSISTCAGIVEIFCICQKSLCCSQ